MKKITLIILLALPLALWANQPVQKGERYDDAVIVDKAPTGSSTEARVDDLAGEPVTTILQPEFQELEDRYAEQLNQLRAQIELAAPDQQEALELQAVALKQELEGARLETVLNYVRAQGNTDAEKRVLEAIHNYQNPTPVQRVSVERDPKTGAEKKGVSR